MSLLWFEIWVVLIAICGCNSMTFIQLITNSATAVDNRDDESRLHRVNGIPNSFQCVFKKNLGKSYLVHAVFDCFDVPAFRSICSWQWLAVAAYYGDVCCCCDHRTSLYIQWNDMPCATRTMLFVVRDDIRVATILIWWNIGRDAVKLILTHLRRTFHCWV